MDRNCRYRDSKLLQLQIVHNGFPSNFVNHTNVEAVDRSRQETNKRSLTPPIFTLLENHFHLSFISFWCLNCLLISLHLLPFWVFTFFNLFSYFYSTMLSISLYLPLIIVTSRIIHSYELLFLESEIMNLINKCKLSSFYPEKVPNQIIRTRIVIKQNPRIIPFLVCITR